MTKDERTSAEINLNHLAHNMREIRAHLSPGTRVMAVVKANGYGHGAAEVSRAALASGADCLGVAIWQEGAALRESGITAPIIILGHTTAERFGDVINHGLTQTIFSVEAAKHLSASAVAQGRQASIHIKVDTGMSRLGFQLCQESVRAVKAVAALPNLTICGVFSHLAQSDTPDQSFTQEQAARFARFTDMLGQAGIHIPIRHISNSGAIVASRRLDMEMVRAGIIMYGLPPSDTMDMTGWDLRPALSWKSRISFVRTVEKDTSVSYGRRFFAKERSLIATIPVGYADGFSRALTNVGRVLIGGRFAPVTGTVCMDQFMADVTRIDHVKPGDEAVLIGEQGGQMITANDMGLLRGTIGYEVLCNISERVPRVYEGGLSFSPLTQ